MCQCIVVILIVLVYHYFGAEEVKDMMNNIFGIVDRGLGETCGPRKGTDLYYMCEYGLFCNKNGVCEQIVEDEPVCEDDGQN